MFELIDPVFLAAMQQKYNIIDTIRFLHYDQDFVGLKYRLLGLKKKNEFLPNDRIIINHFDTDYFIHNQFGINLTNFFTVWEEVDLPKYLILLYTNNPGIGREIDVICQHSHPADRPTVFETFIDPASYSYDTYKTEPDMNIEQIEYHGLAMMNAPRTHRYALYNHIQHLSKKLVLTIRTADDYNKNISSD